MKNILRQKHHIIPGAASPQEHSKRLTEHSKRLTMYFECITLSRETTSPASAQEIRSGVIRLSCRLHFGLMLTLQSVQGVVEAHSCLQPQQQTPKQLLLYTHTPVDLTNHKTKQRRISSLHNLFVQYPWQIFFFDHTRPAHSLQKVTFVLAYRGSLTQVLFTTKNLSCLLVCESFIPRLPSMAP